MKKGLLALLTAAFVLAVFPLATFGQADFGAPVPIDTGSRNLGIWEMDWSPDGKWIALRANYDVWIVPVEGGTPVMVSAPPDSTMANVLPHIYPSYVKAFYAAFEPCFTPDSKEIMFTRVVTQMDNKGFPLSPAISYIEARNIATGGLRTIRSDGYGGNFSSDGKYLAYVQHSATFDGINNKYPEVILYDTQNDVATSFPEIFDTLGLLNLNRVRISPDHTWLIFEAQHTSVQFGNSGNYDIYRMPITGGTIEKLTSNTTAGTIYNYYSSISPDGKYILYTDLGTSGQTMLSASLKIYSTISGKTTPWFPENTAWGIWMGCWSPDGKKILYARLNAAYTWPTDIFIRDFTPPEDDITPSGVTDAAPAGFALTGNYPNPFNPTTTISFTLPSSGAASLSVYSVTGQKVRELVSGPMNAGAHAVVWDGRDMSGKPVSSGVYLSRLSMGSYITAGRMLLAK